MAKTSLNKILLLTTVMIFSGTVFLLFTFAGDNGANAEEFPEKESRKLLTVISPEIPKKATFAGENAPLELFYVREALDRELLVNSYWHSSTILMLKRANRWFPVIEPILEENGIPDDFKYVALIESGFARVVSPRGAAGFWQFLEKTAREYGLEVNDYVDERYHPLKSTAAACSYFKESFESYGNWTLVAAAYNAGKRRISESLENQKGESYYDLSLNEETARYIYRVLAIKILYENRETYGFHLSDKDLYQPLQTNSIEVDTTINDLAEFAKENGMNYKLLKELNPWLRMGSLPNSSGRHYRIETLVQK
jgi:hypothetical protein